MIRRLLYNNYCNVIQENEFFIIRLINPRETPLLSIQVCVCSGAQPNLVEEVN